MTFNLIKSAKFLIGGLLILATSITSLRISSLKDKDNQYTQKKYTNGNGPKIKTGHVLLTNLKESRKKIVTWDLEDEVYRIYKCSNGSNKQLTCTSYEDLTPERMAAYGLTQDMLTTWLAQEHKNRELLATPIGGDTISIDLSNVKKQRTMVIKKVTLEDVTAKVMILQELKYPNERRLLIGGQENKLDVLGTPKGNSDGANSNSNDGGSNKHSEVEGNGSINSEQGGVQNSVDKATNSDAANSNEGGNGSINSEEGGSQNSIDKATNSDAANSNQGGKVKEEGDWSGILEHFTGLGTDEDTLNEN